MAKSMAKQNKNKEELDASGMVAAIGEPAKSIPKLASNVNILKQSDGKVVLRFFSKVGPEPLTLIETIIVDEAHAHKIVEVLTGVLIAKELKKK